MRFFSRVFAALACGLATFAMFMPLTGASETFEFQAEVSRLMDLIVNSLYSNKGVFIREVISNAADALDKVRYLAIENPSILEDNSDLEIRIAYDEDEHTITVTDTGIGMTKDELIQNLGTVARSGTTQFVESMASGGDLNLIGQFGVGFYAVYLVSDRVVVTSKSPNDAEQHIWESTADSTFSVRADPDGNTLGRGTEIKMYLKEDTHEYGSEKKLNELVSLYSEFIQFPIYLQTHDSESGSGSDDGAKANEESVAEEESDGNEESDGKEKSDEEEIAESWIQVNTQPAIWNRNPSDLTDEEYTDFFRVVAKDHSQPLTWTHFRAEGDVDFSSILYIPTTFTAASHEGMMPSKADVKLYVRNVLVSDSFSDLFPRYLNFLKGVVDSDDVPINVSREQLQEHKVLKKIGKKLVRKVLDLLRKLSDAEIARRDDGEKLPKAEEMANKYVKFWKEYGRNIKVGLIDDLENRERLLKLLRFKSSRDNGESEIGYSLDEYIANAPSWQKSIYILSGRTLDEIKASPFLERAKAKGVEVLFWDDPIDEYLISHLVNYDSYEVVSLSKEGVKFDSESDGNEETIEKLYAEKYKTLCEWFKTKITGVQKALVSPLLKDSPAVIVSSKYGASANMERITRAQALGKTGPLDRASRILEINPRHPIISRLNEMVEANEDDKEAYNLAMVLVEAVGVASGYELMNPKLFSDNIYTLMKYGLTLDSLDPLPEMEIPDSESSGEDEEEKLEL